METVQVSLTKERLDWLKKYLTLELIKQTNSYDRWTNPKCQDYYHEDIRNLLLKEAGTDYDTHVQRRLNCLTKLKSELMLLGTSDKVKKA